MGWAIRIELAWAAWVSRVAPVAWSAFVVLAMLATGCGASAVGELRFENREPILTVADRRPIPEPQEHEVGKITASAGALLGTEPMYLLSLPGAQPARDVNAFEEVPDSSWFTNRIGQHELSPAEVARGPGAGGPVAASRCACFPRSRRERRPGWSSRTLRERATSSSSIRSGPRPRPAPMR
jgi:hypothetical protein